ncbi:8-oxo-dGTP diphosphatase [Verrucomicrobiaceae bacterium R5-34]|uniref:Oxidized purine nucleoside triphosphate hydrolase n=1 Tax=Oceaniferula flava TaxID=2800421 RepID=A0AAE2SA46_9BACT|nr:8-oxo-dGTP diphosphatase [Oceaniferula flavus]MBK1829355.1 8-oxo-dGTP diphosphatase [Verrucomicrobiaceae bacterium R5-34]MBK1853582.1 8-oxo-dGTP diphosphatase [Oceaniferula flavus]MBM1134887.1 8-oxo-dGTP diphosphatase [Oceaniferula flavus]
MEDCSVDWSVWQGEMPATLMFIVRDGEVLLIEKLRGIGMGKINGPGGKIDPGETPLECVIRECQEELHITPIKPVKMGELWFAMSDIPDIHCHVFTATEFEGTPTATEEAVPIWTKIEDIPWDKMWEDDAHWLPQMLEGQKFLGRFLFEGERMQWRDVQLEDAGVSGWLIS